MTLVEIFCYYYIKRQAMKEKSSRNKRRTASRGKCKPGRSVSVKGISGAIAEA